MCLTEFFEAGFERRGRHINECWEALDFLEMLIKRDPYSAGVQHPGVPEFWVWESPPVKRIPKMYILYTIDEARGAAILRSFSIK